MHFGSGSVHWSSLRGGVGGEDEGSMWFGSGSAHRVVDSPETLSLLTESINFSADSVQSLAVGAVVVTWIFAAQSGKMLLLLVRASLLSELLVWRVTEDLPFCCAPRWLAEGILRHVSLLYASRLEKVQFSSVFFCFCFQFFVESSARLFICQFLYFFSISDSFFQIRYWSDFSIDLLFCHSLSFTCVTPPCKICLGFK